MKYELMDCCKKEIQEFTGKLIRKSYSAFHVNKNTEIEKRSSKTC